MKHLEEHRTVSLAGLLIVAVAGLAWVSHTGAAHAGSAQEAQETEPPPPADEAPKVERAPVVVERARVVSPDDESKTGVTPPAPSIEAPPGAARPGHHAVHEVRLLKAGAGRVEGARQDDWIAFDMIGGDERYDVFIMRIGLGVEKCLTCDNWEFRKVNALNPSWHPSGDYLAIQVQSSPKRRGSTPARLATPFRGLGSELWIVARDGRDAWQITKIYERGGAVLDPHFSHEAGLLVWSERLTSREPPWGEWGLRVVDFRIKRGVPHLGKTRTYRSGIGYGLVVAHDFAPDDRRLLLSAIPDRGLPEPDILSFDLETEKVVRLTSSPDQSDELVSAVPYSDYLVWVTDRGLGDPRRLASGQRTPLRRRGEVWLRSASGMAQERLTYFNDPRSDHYLGAAQIGDLSWTADGESLLLHVVSVPDGSIEVREGIYLVTLGKEYRR